MKVLIVSQGEWDDDSSFGNTFNNFFHNWDKSKIAHIYTNSGNPNTTNCSTFLNISENMVFKSILRKKIQVSSVVVSHTRVKKKNVKFMKLPKINIFYFFREILWQLGKIDFIEVYRFIDNFNPDLILVTASNTVFLNKIQKKIIDYCKIPTVMYTADDGYTLKQFSLSIFFWINRFRNRFYFRKTIKNVDHLFVISDKQSLEYSKLFNVNTSVLTKTGEFDNKPKIKQLTSEIKFIYTGNIGLNRWKSLISIGRQLEIVEKRNKDLTLYVYTNFCSKRVEKKLKKISTIKFMGHVPAAEIPEVQSEADVLVFCESFKFRDSLRVRLSFSTKLIDYMEKRKCILAVGHINSNSIRYLDDNKAAIISTKKSTLSEKIALIINNERTIPNYADRAWNLGYNNHNISKSQSSFETLLREIIRFKSK
jgi:hypothetical protein